MHRFTTTVCPRFLLIAALITACADPVAPPAPTGSCQTFNACGGDPSGRWSVFDVCYDVDDFLAATEAAIDKPECAGWLLHTEITVGGTLTFSEGTLDSQLMLNQRLETQWTQACLSAIASEDAVLDQSTCDALGSAIAMDSGVGAICEIADDVCLCQAEVSSRLPSTVSYTLEGGQVVTSKGRSDFCVGGDDLLFSGKAGPNTPELIMLLRRD